VDLSYIDEDSSGRMDPSDLNDEDPDGSEDEHPIATLNIELVKEVTKDRYPEQLDLFRKVEENRRRTGGEKETSTLAIAADGSERGGEF
jgi:hypothetical protein